MATTVTGVANADHKIRIPLASAFTGPYVDFGERLFNQGRMPAVREINAAGGINGHTLEFYKMDVRFPDTQAFLADLRLECSKPDVPMIFGIGATKTQIAAMPILKKCKIPAFNPTSGGAWPFPDFGGWLFRYLPTPEKTLPVMFRKVLPKFGVKTAAISHTNHDDFAVNNIKIVRKSLADNGVKIVSDQSIKTKETNFQSQVAATKRANPDAIVLIHQPGDAGTLLRQIRDRGVKAQVFTDIIIGGVNFWKLSEGRGIGSIGYALYAADDPRPIVQNWISKWRKMTGKMEETPDNFVTSYYDAILVLADILRSVEDVNNREQIRDAFLTIKNRETISGTISWEEVGEVTRSNPILVKMHENGVLKRWEP